MGGATYRSYGSTSLRRTALAMRWLVDAAAKRSEKFMVLRLAGELLDAADGKGNALKNVTKFTVWLTQTKRSHTIVSN